MSVKATTHNDFDIFMKGKSGQNELWIKLSRKDNAMKGVYKARHWGEHWL